MGGLWLVELVEAGPVNASSESRGDIWCGSHDLAKERESWLIRESRTFSRTDSQGLTHQDCTLGVVGQAVNPQMLPSSQFKKKKKKE